MSLRVVQVLHGWPPDQMGGTGLYVEALARALAARGHAVALAHPAVPGAAVGLQVEETPLGLRVGLQGPPPRRWEDTWRDPARVGVWRRWLRAWGAEVVHIHHLSGLPVGLVQASQAVGARVVITLHDYALPCARGQLVDRAQQPCPGPAPARCAACLGEHLHLDPVTAGLGALLARWPGLRQQARGHLARALPAPGPRAQARVQARQAAVRAALAAADRLLSPSADLAERFARMGIGGVQQAELPLLRPVPPAPVAPPGPVRFLFASSILPTKGPHLLLEAYRHLPPGTARLTFAGPAPPFDGQPRYAAELQAAARSVAGVQWRGALPAEAIPALLAEHDVLVLPSLWPENSPLIVREATAAGLVVVVSAVGGAAALAPEARTVPPGDVGALADALRAEVAQGRRRLAPLRWPSPEAHAAWLETEVYGDVLRRVRN